MNQPRLNDIWKNIKSGTFKKNAEEWRAKGVASLCPVEVYDDEAGQMMSIPGGDLVGQWVRKKPESQNEWELFVSGKGF